MEQRQGVRFLRCADIAADVLERVDGHAGSHLLGDGDPLAVVAVVCQAGVIRDAVKVTGLRVVGPVAELRASDTAEPCVAFLNADRRFADGGLKREVGGEWIFLNTVAAEAGTLHEQKMMILDKAGEVGRGEIVARKLRVENGEAVKPDGVQAGELRGAEIGKMAKGVAGRFELGNEGRVLAD